MSCSFSVFVSTKCGATKKSPAAETVPLINCKRDVSKYLRSLGATGVRGRPGDCDITEVDLILNRAGLFIISEDEINKKTICPLHRDYLTTNWPGGKAARCSYPFHEKRPPRTGGNARVRRVTKQVSEEIFWTSNVAVAIGDGKNFYIDLYIIINIQVPRASIGCQWRQFQTPMSRGGEWWG